MTSVNPLDKAFSGIVLFLDFLIMWTNKFPFQLKAELGFYHLYPYKEPWRAQSLDLDWGPLRPTMSNSSSQGLTHCLKSPENIFYSEIQFGSFEVFS